LIIIYHYILLVFGRYVSVIEADGADTHKDIGWGGQARFGDLLKLEFVLAIGAVVFVDPLTDHVGWKERAW
jgi:hypothetical protein